MCWSQHFLLFEVLFYWQRWFNCLIYFTIITLLFRAEVIHFIKILVSMIETYGIVGQNVMAKKCFAIHLILRFTMFLGQHDGDYSWPKTNQKRVSILLDCLRYKYAMKNPIQQTPREKQNSFLHSGYRYQQYRFNWFKHLEFRSGTFISSERGNRSCSYY